MNGFDPGWIEAIGLTLLHFIWQGLLIGALFATAGWLVRPATAATRYNLAVAALLALALAPALTMVYLLAQPAPALATRTGTAAIAVLSISPEKQAASISHLLAWTVALWAAGVFVLSVRLILGWRFLRRLRRSAALFTDGPLVSITRRLAASMGVARTVCVGTSERLYSPIVIGWLKPLILFPPAVINHLPVDQLEMVLAHELAHIRRHDHLVHWFQTVVETLLFYHPVVAWVSRRVRIERENACDDLVVESTANRMAYVEMLATLERLRPHPNRLVLAVHDGQMLSRIRRLVHGTQPVQQRGLMLPIFSLVTLLISAAALHWIDEPEPSHLDLSAPLPNTAAPTPTSATATQASENLLTQAVATPTASIDGLANPGPAGRDPEDSAAPAPTPARETEPPLVAVPETAPIRPQTTNNAVASEPRKADRSLTVGHNGPSTAKQAPVDRVEPDRSPSAGTEQDLPELPVDPVQLAALSPPGNPLLEPDALEREAKAMASAAAETPLVGGTIISRVDPVYPRQARRAGTGGRVEVDFLVDAQGRVSDARVLREIPQDLSFGKAALKAIQKWQFEPYRRGRQIVERRARVTIEFDLEAPCRPVTGTRLPRC